jgi:hypothetical protein
MMKLGIRLVLELDIGAIFFGTGAWGALRRHRAEPVYYSAYWRADNETPRWNPS